MGRGSLPPPNSQKGTAKANVKKRNIRSRVSQEAPVCGSGGTFVPSTATSPGACSSPLVASTAISARAALRRDILTPATTRPTPSTASPITRCVLELLTVICSPFLTLPDFSFTLQHGRPFPAGYKMDLRLRSNQRSFLFAGDTRGARAPALTGWLFATPYTRATSCGRLSRIPAGLISINSAVSCSSGMVNAPP
jgi:hypothetical protein